jgi:glycosyltransferase involved in cell wall biosynthesis
MGIKIILFKEISYMKNKKIVILTSAHEPDDVRIYHKEIKSLMKIYSNITIIAPRVERRIGNYNEKIELLTFQPRKSQFILNYFKPLCEMYKIVKKKNPDILHCHEPDSLLVGYLCIRNHNLNCKLIYDCHEYHPEAISERFPFFLNKIIDRLVFYFENFLAKRSDLIITVNEILVDKFKTFHKNVIKLPNYPCLETLQFEDFNKRPIEFIYIGLISAGRGIYKIIEAVKLLSERGHTFNILLMGRYSSDYLKQKVNYFINKNNLNSYFIFIDEIPFEEVYDYISKAKVGLLFLQPGINRYTIAEPIKLFEYLGNGLAVLANDYSMVKKIIDANDCGVTMDPTDVCAIANSMEEMILNPEKYHRKGLNGKKAILENYNWEKYEPLFLQKYSELLDQQS